jgi:hypothetical protein
MRPDSLKLRRWTIGLAAVAALALAGCGGDDAKTVTVGASGGGTSQASADEGDSDGGGGSVDTSDALATKTVRGVGSKDGTVEIAIVGLKVEDRLMRLTLAFSPKYPSVTPGETISLYDMNGNSPLYVTLVDPVNLKRYIVVKDSSGSDLAADNVSTDTPSGGTVSASYTFAAPPADVDKIDVTVGEWPTFSDVAIQR